MFNLEKLCKFSILVFKCVYSNIKFIPLSSLTPIASKIVLGILSIWRDPGVLRYMSTTFRSNVI